MCNRKKAFMAIKFRKLLNSPEGTNYECIIELLEKLHLSSEAVKGSIIQEKRQTATSFRVKATFPKFEKGEKSFLFGSFHVK